MESNVDWYDGDKDDLVIDNKTYLIPCEHCGKDVFLIKREGKWVIDDPTCRRHHWESNSPCWYRGKEGLVEWWNTRASKECFVDSVEFVDGTDWPHWDWYLTCDHVVTTSEKKAPKFCIYCGKKIV